MSNVHRFRKRPVVIEAMQFDGHNYAEAYSWMQGVVPGQSAGTGHVLDWQSPGGTLDAYIDTLEGRMHVTPGDWIIRGVKGEFYPCKPDIFDATYEPASDTHEKPTSGAEDG